MSNKSATVADLCYQIRRWIPPRDHRSGTIFTITLYNQLYTLLCTIVAYPGTWSLTNARTVNCCCPLHRLLPRRHSLRDAHHHICALSTHVDDDSPGMEETMRHSMAYGCYFASSIRQCDVRYCIGVLPGLDGPCCRQKNRFIPGRKVYRHWLVD